MSLPRANILRTGNIRDENVDTVKSFDNSIPSIDLQVPLVFNASAGPSSSTITTTKASE